MTDAFTGFPAAGLEFLHDLSRRDKAWFDTHRDSYTTSVVAPTKAFVVALGARLRDEVSPGIVAEPRTNGSIGPINNDRLVDRHETLEIAGADLKRVPKPYPDDHARSDLLRHNTMIQARWPEPAPVSITSAAFVDHCAERLLTCSPLHHWFLANLT